MSVGKKQLEYASGALRKFRYKSFKWAICLSFAFYFVSWIKQV
jgi:hypothetical protein